MFAILKGVFILKKESQIKYVYVLIVYIARYLNATKIEQS